MSVSANSSTAPRGASKRNLQWRVVDIIVATVLALASGLLFMFWNSVGYAWLLSLEALTPGLGGLATGTWFIGGTLGALIIRKPGAAIYCEVLAALVEPLLGAQWGFAAVWSGIAQGLAVEIVVAIFLYRKFNLQVAMLAGAAAGVGAWILELVLYGNLAKGPEYLAIYLVTLLISGALIAGLGAHLVAKALAKTGALDRFAVGREARAAV
ncbi:membrane protein [Corynebacterium phocae]|uniref:Membrane protein n=1 Tax=Corynebacterium phocae TaxID=161895 RepID=A0A1L7D581_9CORY|nr:ECF transporter S component [Corynebacterium phocae]APT93275.1 membrane protein [Corynebacterium phocae]KAA8721599.1 hypothetical protein F4V58_10125 [Corynebacterium phocae]